MATYLPTNTHPGDIRTRVSPNLCPLHILIHGCGCEDAVERVVMYCVVGCDIESVHSYATTGSSYQQPSLLNS